MAWTKQQARQYARDAIKANRAAWEIVPSLRDAIIARAYASVVSNQAMDTIQSDALHDLWRDMLEAAELVE